MSWSLSSSINKMRFFIHFIFKGIRRISFCYSNRSLKKEKTSTEISPTSKRRNYRELVQEKKQALKGEIRKTTVEAGEMYFSKQELLVNIKLGYFIKRRKNAEKFFSRIKKKFVL